MIPSVLRGERAVAWAQTDMGVCVLTRSAFRRLRFRFMGPEIMRPWSARVGAVIPSLQEAGEVGLEEEVVLTSTYWFKTLI